MSFEADRRDEDLKWPSLDGEDGPARRLRPADAVKLVTSAVEASFAPVSPWRRRVPVFLWAAAAAFALAGAAAAITTAARRDREPSRAVAPPAQAGSAPSAPSVGRMHRSVDAARLEVTPSAVPSPSDDSASAPSAIRTATGRRAADDLLEKANQQRRAGEWRRAEATYAQVIRAHPATAQAYVATLAAAALRLDHLGDPAGALRLYQSVKPAGALAAEALFGVARCHRALGNRDAEAAALRQLVAFRPGSLLLRQAEDRLRELEGGAR